MLFLAVPPGRADNHCDANGSRFASCQDAPRDFKAVILVVPGWNGSCDSTFGNGDASVFRVLRAHRFFDFDCFAYNSLSVDIQRNAARLRVHLHTLAENDYSAAMLVTHSTGGVLALDVLTRLFLDASGNPRRDLTSEPLQASNGLQINAIQAWATPINGLRRQIDFAGSLLTVTGFSPETLPSLAPGSDYLQTLKKRLATVGYIYADNATDAELRARIRRIKSVNFYHGNRNDWVVAGIDKQVGLDNGWLWPNGRSEVIDTESGHTHNISRSGTLALIGKPRFPGRAMSLEAMISLPFLPRYEDLFTSDREQIPPELRTRQEAVIDALLYYSRYRFADAMQPSIEFLRLMLATAFTGARDLQLDRKLVNGVLSLIEEQSREPDQRTISFLVQFVHGVLAAYDPGGLEDFQRVGRNQSDVVISILQMVERIHSLVLQYLSELAPQERTRLVAPYPTVAEFEASIHAVLSRFYRSGYHTVQSRAMATTATVMRVASADALEFSGLDLALADFYSANRGGLPLEVKSDVAQAIRAAATKSDVLRERVHSRWTTEVAYSGLQRPLWATLGDDTAIAKMVGDVGEEQATRPSTFRLLTTVAGEAGATGNNTQLAREAGKKAVDALARTPNAPERAALKQIMEQAAQSSRLPSIQRRFESALRR